ncbi:coiled-coil domain-containing protein 114 [Electrophorus electricus]|nr:coiled-coil domain-containing protein 114 [Electrophorus electricus]XP_026873334.1 coiled-coil domain-containing protein 114 [Electrophorus electricus]XP_026873335.1 coiled-coil domain-containing protein 114 [Electrophorus electricus]
MPRGRSATSVHSDSSEMDFDGIAETEIGKLQRQFRIMEGDRQAYSIQSQEILRKQRLEMEKLRKEQEELQKRLCVSDSDAHRLSDDQNGRRLRSLLTQGNELQEELEQERRSQTELEKEILNVEKKLAELRKGEVSASSTQQSLVRHTRKATCTLENKLDRALVRFNQQLTRNRHLREELETLRVERLRFQQLYHKLDKELQEVRREAGDVISTSTAAYDARLEAQSKMMMMKEKAVKDLAQYSSEVKELERVITHERHLREFMTTKSKERSNRGNTQELIRRQELKAQQRADSGEESMETLEDVFQRIQKVTEEEDLEKLVNRFLQVEDKNFALFNYVNEQNTQAETLRDEISQIKEEMERFRVEGVRQVEEHHMALKQVEEQQREAESHALEYEAQANIIGKVLDQIKTGVNSIFIKINCDHAMVDDWLDSSSRIRDSSIMSYLSLVEQRTSQLLTLQAFLNSKDLEKDYDPKMVAQCLLGQNPELQKETAVIRPAGTGEDNDSEESLFTDEDDRPLTQEELRQRIMNIVLRKEGGFSAERGKEEKFSKLGTLTSQRHHSLEL